MDLEKMRDIVKKLHGGASYVVVYKKQMKAIDGSIVIKTTYKPCRLGVRYNNIKQMVGLKAGPLPGNGHWVIDKYVYEDNNGYKLRITNGAFGKSKSRYERLDGSEVDRDKVAADNSSHAPIVQCIKLENVISIMSKGESL